MQGLHRVLNMPQHDSRSLNRTLVCQSMSGFTIIDRVLNVTGFSIIFLIQHIARGHS